MNHRNHRKTSKEWVSRANEWMTEQMSIKSGDNYSSVVSFLRRRFRFDFLKTNHQADLLQEDLNRLYEWTTTWKMQFNGKKCHVLHIGKTNPKYLYHINGCLVTPVNKENDLGVVMTRDLKASSNVTECVKRANQTLGMIKRTFSYLDETSFVQLYKLFVRP